MGKKNLKYQFLNAINANFKPGMDKHSTKKNGGLGTSKIYSFSDRKNLIDVASNFSNYIKEHYPNIKQVKDIKAEHIQSFLNNKAESCSYATLQQYQSKFRKLEKCVNKTYNTNADYSGFSAPLGRENTKLRNSSMSHGDFSKLENALSNSHSSAKVAIQLGARTGLRVSECAKIQGRDINLNAGYVHIADSKGGRDRNVPIRSCDMGYFSGLKASFGDNQRLCPAHSDSINKAINRAMDTAGISGNYSDTSMHSIRKMYAQDQFDQYRSNGMSIEEAWGQVSQELGHSEDRMDLLNTYVLNVH